MTKRKMEYSSGKRPATRVRPLISGLRRSRCAISGSGRIRQSWNSVSRWAVSRGDLRGVYLKTAELFEHLGDPVCGDAVEIHFSDGSLEGALGAGAGFEQRGAEGPGTAADLRNGEVQFPDGGLEGSRFEAIGVAVAGFVALVGLHLHVAGAFDEHFCDAWEAFPEPVLEKGIDGLRGEGIGVVSAHGWCWFWFAPSCSSFDRAPATASEAERHPATRVFAARRCRASESATAWIMWWAWPKAPAFSPWPIGSQSKRPRTTGRARTSNGSLDGWTTQRAPRIGSGGSSPRPRTATSRHVAKNRPRRHPFIGSSLPRRPKHPALSRGEICGPVPQPGSRNALPQTQAHPHRPKPEQFAALSI